MTFAAFTLGAFFALIGTAAIASITVSALLGLKFWRAIRDELSSFNQGSAPHD